MRYNKQIYDNYVMTIGTGAGGEEITEDEYNAILTVVRARPSEPGKGYRLKTNLTWEAYDLPPEPEPSDDDELTDAEALDMILGGTA